MAAAKIALPPHFRTAEILAFHGRDPMGVSETIHARGLRKGLIWRGLPAVLSLRFADGWAEATLAIDGPGRRGDAAALTGLARRMLGLSQQVELFEAAYRDHPELGRLIARHPGLRLPAAASPFEALTWAVTGQQISVVAAVALRRRLIEATAIRHSSGLLCYPDAAAILRLGEDALRRAGYSRTKAATLIELAHRSEAGVLPLDLWLGTMAMAEAGEKLLATPGIGPWTVSYALLRGYGWLDGSLHGDLALRRGLASLLGAPQKLREREAELWLRPFSPWRALVAAHLWAWDQAQMAPVTGSAG